MASVLWTWGHSWAVSSCPASRFPVQADAVQDGTGVEQFEVVALPQGIGDDGGGFGRVRRAGHVGHHSAGPDSVQGRLEQFALQRAEVREVLGRAAPAGLRPAAQGAEAAAGHVHQDAVEGPGHFRAHLAAVSGPDMPDVPAGPRPGPG